MSESLLPPFVLVTYGTSLTTGRLSTNWAERLKQQLLGVPEAIGPFILYNLGKGSQTSTWGADNAYIGADMRPTHILSETFAINDCALVGSTPAVSQSQNLINMGSMRSTWLAAAPSVNITWQSMNGVSTSGASLRPDLATYYNSGMAQATAWGDTTLDNYNGTQSPPGVSTGWIKPLPDALTDNSDGLHPIWTGAVETYLFPNVLFWARKKMATFWGLSPPSPS